jgi:hypothetical protein
VFFEAIQVSCPKLAVGGKPLVEFGQRLRPDAIEAALRIRAGLDEPGGLEHPEVFRHGGLAEAELLDELSNGPLAVTEQVEDRQPARFGEYLQCGELAHPAIEYA